MPRYVVERRFDPMSEDELAALALRSKELVGERFPEITWEHSHVCADEDGTLKSYCVYTAPDTEILRSHAGAVGEHTIANVYEIVGDIDPADLKRADPAPGGSAAARPARGAA